MAITVKGIAEVLGALTMEVGRLCVHANINKWSLRKPVVSAGKVTPLLTEDFEAADYGLELKVYGNSHEAVTAVVGGEEWDYVRPEGGMASPLRLTDFEGYDHWARPWFELSVSGKDYAAPGETVAFSTAGDLNTVMKMKSLSGLEPSRTFFGLLVWSETGGKYVWRSRQVSDTDDFEKGLRLIVPEEGSLTTLPEGHYRAVPVVWEPLTMPGDVLTGRLLTGDKPGERTGVWIPLPSEGAAFRVVGVNEGQYSPLRYFTVEVMPGATVVWEETPGGMYAWKATVSGVRVRIRHTEAQVSRQCFLSFYGGQSADGTRNLIWETAVWVSANSPKTVTMPDFTERYVTEPKEMGEFPVEVELSVKEGLKTYTMTVSVIAGVV